MYIQPTCGWQKFGGLEKKLKFSFFGRNSHLWGGGGSTGPALNQYVTIRILFCSATPLGWSDKSGETCLQNQGGCWPRAGRRGGQPRAEIEVGGWSAKGRNTQFCQFKHLRARICRTEVVGGRPRVETPSFANSSTRVLELAELRQVVSQEWESKFGHLHARIYRTKWSVANISTIE